MRGRGKEEDEEKGGKGGIPNQLSHMGEQLVLAERGLVNGISTAWSNRKRVR